MQKFIELMLISITDINSVWNNLIYKRELHFLNENKHKNLLRSVGKTF